MLYRHFDRQGRLLYVGRTNNPPKRLASHRGDKSWWAEVERTTYQEFPTLDALKRAESDAIRYELPKWNVQGAAKVAVEPKEFSPTELAPFQGKDFSFNLTDMHDQQLSLQGLSFALQQNAEACSIDVAMYRYDLAWHAHEVWSQLCGESPGVPTEHVPLLDRAIRQFAGLYSVKRSHGDYRLGDALRFTRAVLDLDEARWYRDWPWSAEDFSMGGDWYPLFSAPLSMEKGKGTYRSYFIKPEALHRRPGPGLVYPYGPGELARDGCISWNCWFSLPSWDLPDTAPYVPSRGAE